MADMRAIETEHAAAEFRQSEPQRHLPPQHATLARRRVPRAGRGRRAFPGDHQHESRALRLGAVQEPQQGSMGLCLRQAVQVDASVDVRPIALRDKQRLARGRSAWRPRRPPRTRIRAWALSVIAGVPASPAVVSCAGAV